MGNRNPLTTSQMENKIDNVKKKWLNKEIELIDLPGKLEHVISTFREDQNYVDFKNYIGNKIFLDENVEKSTEVITGIMSPFVSIIISIISLFISLYKFQPILIGYAVVVIIIYIGFSCIVFPILKKHMGKYARIKSFYQFF
jgi:hypothetical protein